MTTQVVVYSIATGRVRRVVDANLDVSNVLALRAQVSAHAGEGLLIYTKQGGGQDTLIAWQSAVSTATGKTPVNDRSCVIDSSTNGVVGVVLADPACGDGYAGDTLVQDAVAGLGYTYNGSMFFPPPKQLNMVGYAPTVTLS